MPAFDHIQRSCNLTFSLPLLAVSRYSALIADHEQSIRQQQTMKSNPGLYAVSIPTMATQKPASDFRRPPSTDACLPISIATLQVDTTHRGRVLRGSVAVAEPAVMQGVMVLLQDERGDLVRVRS